MDPGQKLSELEQRVFALEQAKLTPPGDSKSFLGNLNPFSQGTSTSPQGESKGFLDKLNPFNGGSRRKSRRSKKSKKSRRQILKKNLNSLHDI